MLYDIIVVGGGPAGLTSAIYGARAGKSVLLLERESVDLTERNVLVSHQFYLPAGSGTDAVERMDSETRTVGNIDAVGADILAPFDYAALGHIHKPMKVGENCRYCGTPLAYSVSEAEQTKGVVMVDMEA